MTLHHSNLQVQVQDQVQVQLLLYCTDAVLHCLIYFYTSALLHYCPTVEEGGDGGGAVVGGDEPAVHPRGAQSPRSQPTQTAWGSGIRKFQYSGCFIYRKPKSRSPFLKSGT